MGFFDSIIKSVGLPVQKEGFQPVSDVENSKTVEQYMKRVDEKITPLEAKIEKLSDDELKAKTTEFRSRLQVKSSFPVVCTDYRTRDETQPPTAVVFSMSTNPGDY